MAAKLANTHGNNNNYSSFTTFGVKGENFKSVFSGFIKTLAGNLTKLTAGAERIYL